MVFPEWNESGQSDRRTGEGHATLSEAEEREATQRRMRRARKGNQRTGVPFASACLRLLLLAVSVSFLVVRNLGITFKKTRLKPHRLTVSDRVCPVEAAASSAIDIPDLYEPALPAKPSGCGGLTASLL